MSWPDINIVNCSVVDPHHVDADPETGSLDPHWLILIRIRIREKRIRIQLLVNDFCEYYFPC